ncbi:MAG: helix-hairpin-helix domain-containing protein [Candidatus Marinimicrobia bacterium]|nr:helix-hairpin-helix domain-containing protein [Candidatus Neomarinimicrobiota bacterium]
MALFTSKEKSIIGFLGLSAVLGFTISQVKHRYSPGVISISSQEISEFKALADSIYSIENSTPKKSKHAISNSKEKDSKVEVEFVNINTANKDELTSLPKIGPVTAERIIHYREDYGSFKSVDDLTNVKGIGPKTLKLIKERIILKPE